MGTWCNCSIDYFEPQASGLLLVKILKNYTEMAKKKRKGKGKRGHYCKICGCFLPNEAFSGKGHRMHVCKECGIEQSMVKNVRKRKEMIMEVFVKNELNSVDQKFLSGMLSHPNNEIQIMAKRTLILFEIKDHFQDWPSNLSVDNEINDYQNNELDISYFEDYFNRTI